MRKLLLCFGLTAALGGAAIITNVSCATPGAPLGAGNASCYAQGFGGYAQANVSSGVILPASAKDAALVSATSIVSALQTGIRGISTTATASASSDISLLFNTDGPQRGGLLELILDQTAWTAPVNGLMWESINAASHSLNPIGVGIQTVWLPIQLGTSFGFAYQQSVTAIGSSLSGLTSGELALQIQLLAFESDGVTAARLFDPSGVPVSPLATPEPSSLGLIAAACIAAGAGWLKRRR